MAVDPGRVVGRHQQVARHRPRPGGRLPRPAGRRCAPADLHHRAVGRRTAGPADPARLGVPRGFARADSLPVVPGQYLDLVVELLPVSALLRAGHLKGQSGCCNGRKPWLGIGHSGIVMPRLVNPGGVFRYCPRVFRTPSGYRARVFLNPAATCAVNKQCLCDRYVAGCFRRRVDFRVRRQLTVSCGPAPGAVFIVTWCAGRVVRLEGRAECHRLQSPAKAHCRRSGSLSCRSGG